ncbi:hypothetical protein JYU14_03375 [Simkania negevensis]|uniref:Uncharacterized protein n=1 Tax=Simkania negevensis TaxID=83561 RepID=A0ABS3AQU0_9BACT|nr:hypothetical protein [Simkania negevensis]
MMRYLLLLGTCFAIAQGIIPGITIPGITSRVFGQLYPSLNNEGTGNGGTTTLRPMPPPEPNVLGVTFGDSPEKIALVLKKEGLTSIREEKPIRSHSVVQTYAYQGVPSSFWATDGKSYMIYFQGGLVTMNFSFSPTYENFLVLRTQLLESLGKRFVVEEKEESIDDLLRAHLAMLKQDEYTAATERSVTNALKRGNTFFFYRIKDTLNELSVILSYNAVKQPGGDIVPKLILDYRSVEGMERIQEYKERNNQTILPGP